MKKIKEHNEARVEDEDSAAGALALLGLGLAGAGIWAWRRKKAQPAGPAFALLPRQSQGQRQPAATSVAQLPRRDFTRPQSQSRYDNQSLFGFAF